MAIMLFDKLTADCSEKYTMSIRLRPGGLSFSAYNRSVHDAFFYKELELDRSKPYARALEDCFFECPFLTWAYKRIQVVCETSQYTIVPKEIFEEEWGEKEREYKYHIIDLEDKLNGSTSYSLHDDSTLDTQLETIKSEYKNKFQDLLMKIYESADDEWENRSNEYQKTIRELEQEIDDLNEELQSKYEDDEDHGADFY